MRTPVLSLPLPELHDPESGRIDARRIADYLHIPLVQLAPTLGRKYTTLHKTPDALAVQPDLASIKRTLEILAQVFGSPGTVRAWLNSRHPDLGGRTALSVILEGHAPIVEQMLEDAVVGQPA